MRAVSADGMATISGDGTKWGPKWIVALAIGNAFDPQTVLPMGVFSDSYHHSISLWFADISNSLGISRLDLA